MTYDPFYDIYWVVNISLTFFGSYNIADNADKK